MQKFLIKTPAGEFAYRISQRKRVTRRLHLELDDTGGLLIIAPPHWSGRRITRVLKQNIPHVERFLIRAREHWAEPLQYQHGELHLYLGESFPLAIHRGAGRKNCVLFDGNEIQVMLKEHNQEKVKSILWAWYQHQAEQVFSERLTLVSARAEWVEGRDLVLKHRRMKRTWGNCSTGGVIKLNTHLVKAPLAVIDSVIAHELCHLVEMNHGRAFYALLEKLNPSWRKDRETLHLKAGGYLR